MRLTYPGDVTEHMHVGQTLNAHGDQLVGGWRLEGHMCGEWGAHGYPLRVKTSTYDEDTDHTVVEFEIAR